jgi:hypothetical protein
MTKLPTTKYSAPTSLADLLPQHGAAVGFLSWHHHSTGHNPHLLARESGNCKTDRLQGIVQGMGLGGSFAVPAKNRNNFSGGSGSQSSVENSRARMVLQEK